MEAIKKKITTNYDLFLKTDTSKFKGEWLAMTAKKIVAHGKDAKLVYEAAKKKAPGHKISLAKAPDEQMLVLKFSL